jgi:septation ring formation regulator EzrA
MAVLASTSFPIVGSVVAGMLPKVILKIRKVTKSAIKKAENTKARIEGRPTPDEQAEINAKIERELKELQELEEQESLARARAESVVDIIESIKRDPLKAAEELGVELSEKDIENMRLSDEEEPEKQSRAKKVNIPSRDPAKRKLTPDEVAARKAAADANRAARLGK